MLAVWIQFPAINLFGADKDPAAGEVRIGYKWGVCKCMPTCRACPLEVQSERAADPKLRKK